MEGRQNQETTVKQPMLATEDERDSVQYGDMEPPLRYDVVQEMFRNPNATSAMCAVLPSSSKGDPYADTPPYRRHASTDEGFSTGTSAEKSSVIGSKTSAGGYRPMSAEVCTALRKLQKEIEDLKDSLCSQDGEKADSIYENIQKRGKRRRSSSGCERSLFKNAKEMGFYRFAHTIDGDSNACRRMVWVILLLCSLVLLSYQLWDRVQLFTSRPSHTSIDTNYVSTLAFPAVTICNLNMPKLTELVNAGLYTAIQDIVGPDRERPITSHSASQLDRITYTDFLHNVSHRKEDLIHSCTWNGVECGPSNLTETLTDIGLCYTFRFHDRAKRDVHMPGPSAGLSFVLNVEQYEYLLSRRTAVGVKVAVHDWQDPPRMLAEGFNVAVGTHTSLGLRKFEYHTLPLSNDFITGDIIDTSAEKKNCKKNPIVEYCKCTLDVPKYKGDNTSPCTVKDYFTCVRNYTGMYEGNRGCPCLRSCKRVEYEVSLSEAASSLYAAESRVLSLNEELPELPARFRHARDTYHRMDFTTFIHDSVILNDTSWELRMVNTSFRSALTHLQEHRLEYDKTLKNLKDTISALNATVGLHSHLFIHNSHAGFHFLLPHLKTTIRDILNKQDIIEHIDNENEAKLNETFSGIMQELDRLALEREYDVIVTGALLKQVLKDVQRFRDDLVEGYGQNYREFKTSFQIYDGKTRIITNITTKLISDLIRKYDEIRNISHLLRQNDRHSRKHRQECKSRLMGFFDSIKQLEQGPIQLLVSGLESLSELYAKHRTNILTLYKEISKAGDFLHSKGDVMQESFHSLQKWLKKIREHVEKLEHALAVIAKDYESGTIPRSELGNQLNGDRLSDEIQASKNLLDDIVSSIAVLHDKASTLAKLTEPLLMRFEDFKLKTAEQVEELRISLQFDGVHKLLENPMKRMDDALSAIVAFKADLDEYTRGCKINAKFYQNNFLQLDVYFQDMTETKIIQRRSYGFIDLACDIGGSLSLYLGASFLTFFALLDLILRSRSSE